MGFDFENGEQSLVETPYSPPPAPFQFKQSTFDGGRANQRATNDQTAYFDSGNMWSLTPEVLHTSQQWGHGVGLINSEEYNPPGRNMAWTKLFGTNRYIASAFTASASWTAQRMYIWLRRYNTPGTLTLELWSSSANLPNAMLQSATITTSTVTDVLSLWQIFSISAQALVSGTTYWVVAIGASTDSATHNWQVGVDLTPASYSRISSTGSGGSWSAPTWRMYFRVAPLVTRATMFPFVYYGQQFVCSKYASGAVSKLFINGDLGKASAGSTTTITKTASGGLTWTTNQLAGAVVRIVGGTGAGGAARVIVSHTSGTTPVFTVSPAFEITPDATSIFIVYDTPYWSEVTSPASGLGVVYSQPVLAGQSVYFPQGTTAIRTMYFDETTGAYVFAADTTNKAHFLRALNDTLWSCTISGQKWVASSAPFAAAKGTVLAYTGSYPIGSLDYTVNGMCDYNNAMYFFKADGVYTVVNGRTTRIAFGADATPDSRNGRVSFSFQDSLWFSFLHSIERMTNRTVDDVGWWRHEGMPEGRDGFASCATTYLSWVMVGINATSTGISSVLCWNGRGWHEIFRANNDGYRVSGIALQPTEERRPRLWVFIENEAVYMSFPYNSTNPLRDSGMVYMHEGYLTTSTIDLGKVNFEKIFRDLMLQTQNLSDTACITVDYQVDNKVGTTEWAQLGGGEEFRVSPLGSTDANLGSKNMIRLRLRFSTEACSTPPILYGLQLNGSYIEPPRYQWNATCRISNIKANAFTGDQVVTWLKYMSQNFKLLEAHSTSLTLHGKRVYITQPTIISMSRNFLTHKWTGRVSFTIREA